MQKAEINDLILNNMNLVYYCVHKYYQSWCKDEDIIQTGMEGLCKAAATWDESKSKFSTYAVRCIRNEINMYFRRNRKHYGLKSLDYDMGNNNIFGDTIPGDDDVVYVDFDGMNKFLGTLAPLQREVLTLRRQGLKYSEVAEQLGLTSNAVGSIIFRLKRKWSDFNEH